MTFQYRLQKIVDLKLNEKTQAEWMLSNAVQRCDEKRTELSLLRSKRDELHRIMAQETAKSASISSLRLLEAHDQHLEQRIMLEQEKLKQAEQHLLERREELHHKMQDEKIWSNAREKARVSHVAKQLQREQFQLDEMSTIRHIR